MITCTTARSITEIGQRIKVKIDSPGSEIPQCCAQTTPLQEVPLDEADTAALDAFTAAFDGAAQFAELGSGDVHGLHGHPMMAIFVRY